MTGKWSVDYKTFYLFYFKVVLYFILMQKATVSIRYYVE